MNSANNSHNNSDNRPQLKVVSPTSNPPTPAATPPISAPAQTSATESEKKTNPGASFLIRLATFGLIVAGISYIGLQPIPVTVSGDATVESTPENREPVNMPESGFVKKIYVRPNDKVSKGTLIMEIQSDDLDKQEDELNSRLIQLDSEIDLANRQLMDSQSNKEQFVIKLQNSRKRTARVRREVVAEKEKQPRILQLESEKEAKQDFIRGLQKEQAILSERFNNYKPLFDKGGLPKDQMLDLQLKRQQTSAQIKQANHQIDAIDAEIADAKKQKNDELVDLREAEVEDAQAAVNSAEQEIQKSKMDVQKWNNQIPVVKEQLEKLKIRKNKLIVRANKPGIIIGVDIDKLEGHKQPEGKEILMIADNNRYSVIVDFKQEDFKLVEKGMRGTFRPLDEFNGRNVIVEEIPSNVSFDPTQQKRTVKVRLKFENESAASLMMGTTGSVHIEVKRMQVYEKVKREFLKLFPIGKFF